MVSVTTGFTRQRADAAPVTLRQLLASGALDVPFEVIAGEDGLDAAVTDVFAGSIRGSSGVLHTEPGVLAVLEGGDLRVDTYQVDMAIRGAHESSSAGIVLCTDRVNVVLAATRLANKLKVPVIVAESQDPIILADALRKIVLEPRMVRSDTLLNVVETLARISGNARLDEVLASVGGSLGADLALVSAEGTLVAGVLDAQMPSVSDLIEVPVTSVARPYTFIAQPLHLARREAPSFWLTARLKAPTDAQVSIVKDALIIASWFVATRLVTDRLERERDARFRMGVLNSILSVQERFEAALLEHLAILGWKVDGWCTAIHLQASGDADPLRILTLTDQLSRSLADRGVVGPVVERPDGWTCWIVDRSEPPANTYHSITGAVEEAIVAFLALAPRLRLHVGVGRPYLGLDGLRTSLAEAKEAATIAQAAGGTSGVQHIDQMGVRRILLGWYTSESFGEFAHTLLGPLLDADVDGSLLHTLEVYLDEESSATVAATRLGVHRNTILNRVDRLRSLLTVDLDDPEERLAVQLACRVVKLKRSENGWES
jgi:PucR family transcriptional regulator, purine catabolism regulatory protein